MLRENKEVQVDENTTTSVEKNFIYGQDFTDPIAMTKGTGVSFLHHADPMWNVTSLTNGAGVVQERYDYGVYGDPTVMDAAWSPLADPDSSLKGNPFLFTGQQYDPESKLYYLRNRYMEPATGRFLTPDPLGAWADPYSYGNAYTYAGNNPASMSDPMGLAAEHNGGAPDIGDAEDDYLRSLKVAGAGGSVPSPSKIVVDFSMHRVRSDLSMSALERFGWHWRCWGSDATHTVLDAAGAVDGWGTPFDVLNIAVCLAEGDLQGALECTMGLLPGLSAQVAVARLSRRARAVARGLDDLEDADDYLGKLKRAVDKAGGLCGDGCFVRGTLVDTRDGPRPIEEIRPGDMVTARDQMTGEIEERQVVQTFEHADSAVVEVTYVDAQGKVETLGATPDHPFHVDGVGWVEAGKLLPGQRVTGLDGDYLVVQHVALDDERHTTYNFEVGEFHTYFVGNGDAWVHNAGKYHPRIRERGVEDPRYHNFPYSFDDEIMRSTPVALPNGGTGYALPGYINNEPVIYNIVVRGGEIEHRDAVKVADWERRMRNFSWPRTANQIWDCKL